MHKAPTSQMILAGVENLPDYRETWWKRLKQNIKGKYLGILILLHAAIWWRQIRRNKK